MQIGNLQKEIFEIMPKTVYQLLIEKNIQFSRKDLRSIANWINARWRKTHEEQPGKTEQKENDRTFTVYNYPDEWFEDMNKVVQWFFLNKQRRFADTQKKMEEARLHKKELEKQGEKNENSEINEDTDELNTQNGKNLQQQKRKRISHTLITIYPNKTTDNLKNKFKN